MLDENDLKALLIKLIQEIHELNQKFDSVAKQSSKILNSQEELLENFFKQNPNDENIKLEPDMETLFSIPNSLRKTILALYKLEEATAEDLALETKRLRAVESSAANQLVRMGILNKRREGRKVYFSLNS